MVHLVVARVPAGVPSMLATGPRTSLSSTVPTTLPDAFLTLPLRSPTALIVPLNTPKRRMSRVPTNRPPVLVVPVTGTLVNRPACVPAVAAADLGCALVTASGAMSQALTATATIAAISPSVFPGCFMCGPPHILIGSRRVFGQAGSALPHVSRRNRYFGVGCKAEGSLFTARWAACPACTLLITPHP